MELRTRNNFEGWMQKLMERLDRQDELLLAMKAEGKQPTITAVSYTHLHLQFSWFAFGKERFPGKFHAFTGGKHGINEKQGSVIQ